MSPRDRKRAGASGQASVELLAAIPLLTLMVLAVWQAAVAARSAALAVSASRAGARAVAVGGDSRRAVERALPAPESARAKVVDRSDNRVEVGVAVPSVLGRASLGRLSSSSGFEGGAP